MIQLSILIPSIPSRFERSFRLYHSLLEMIGEKKIEVIMLTDNKVMTIGEKHNHLKNSCHGKYFMFLHDDDELLSLDSVYQATFSDVDVIDFKAICKNENGTTYIVTQKLGNEVEHNTEEGIYLDCNRPPFPNCAWHNKFKKNNFPNISFSEDWEWVNKCLSEATTEYFIDEIIFSYNFDKNVTEASTESNEFWKNPNI